MTAAPGVSARTRGGRFSIRAAISTLVVGLLVATVAAVVAVALTIRSRTVAATAASLQAEISARIREKVEERFGPLSALLEELRASARRGLLPLDDHEALAARLAERVRFDGRMEWLALLRADGSGAGAARGPDRTLRVFRRERGAAGPAVVEVWREDGTRVRDEAAARDLAAIREVEWYRLGTGADEPVWTAPYVRALDGMPGRACVLAVRAGQVPVGVFGLGFGVEFLREYIATLRAGESGRVFTLHPDRGEIGISPSPGDRERLGPAVAAAIESLPGGVAALADGRLVSIPVTHGHVAYRVGLSRQQPAGLPAWVHAIVIPEEELVGYFRGYLAAGLAATVVLLAIAILLAQLLSRRVARPLHTLAADLERVGTFELTPSRLPPSWIREVAVVRDAAEGMKASLRSFGRYVPTELVRDLLRQGREARLGGVERCLTLFFSDVEGFTGLSEGLAPQAVVEALGDYLDVVTAAVRAQRGTIDKFIGDGVLAIFNAPHEDPEHVAHACRAALDLQTRLAEHVERWQALGRPPFRTRVGLHTDRVVVGNIGTPERFAYTVIGDGVNLAARLESLNKAYGTWIIASEPVRGGAGDGFAWRRLDRTAVAGRAAGGDVFELFGEADAVDPARLEARDRYEEALESYLDRRFAEAVRGFAEAARLRPDDRAAAEMRRRAERFATDPPPADWNGVYLQTGK